MTGDLTVGTDWVRQRLGAGEQLFFVEVGRTGDVELAVMKARGALRLTEHELQGRLGEIPREGEVVVYTTAPIDAPAAEVVRALISRGYPRAHLLLGGFRAYLSAGLPVEQVGEGRNMTRLRGL